MDEEDRTEERSSPFSVPLSRRRFLRRLIGLNFLGSATAILKERATPLQGQGQSPETESLATAPYPSHPAGTPETAVTHLNPSLNVSDPMTFDRQARLIDLRSNHRQEDLLPLLAN